MRLIAGAQPHNRRVDDVDHELEDAVPADSTIRRKRMLLLIGLYLLAAALGGAAVQWLA